MGVGADVVLGVDVGGTSVKAALVDAAGAFIGAVEQIPVDASGDAESILSAICDGLLRVAAGAPDGLHGLAAVGIGTPGPFDYERGISLITGVAKYESLYGLDVGAAIRARMKLRAGVPVRFLNDACAFALGEGVFGAARGFDRVMAITLGTGCGSAFVTGHGCNVIEGGVYRQRFRESIVDNYISRRGILDLAASLGVLPSASADVVDLAAAAHAGNAPCLRLFREWGTMLAEALKPSLVSFRPDCVVIGGAIARSLDLFRAPLDHIAAALTVQGVASLKVVPAADVHSAVRGAAEWARRGGRQAPTSGK